MQAAAGVRRAAWARADLFPQAGIRAERARGGSCALRVARYLNYEGEIAIVIGRTTAQRLARTRSGASIAGYTVANDFGLHDFRDTDAGSMLRVKGSDTLCPLGPGLVDDWDPRDKSIRTTVNGVVRQDGRTAEMVWGMNYLVADIARTITLVPGDVICSGTPAGRAPCNRATRCRSPSRASARSPTTSSTALSASAATLAHNRRSPRRCARPPSAATGSCAESAHPGAAESLAAREPVKLRRG